MMLYHLTVRFGSTCASVDFFGYFDHGYDLEREHFLSSRYGSDVSVYGSE